MTFALKFGSNCAHHKQLRYKKHQQSHANMWFLMEITCSFYQIISWKNWHVGFILTNKKDRKINMRLNQLLFFFPGLRRMLSFGERSIWKRKYTCSKASFLKWCFLKLHGLAPKFDHKKSTRQNRGSIFNGPSLVFLCFLYWNAVWQIFAKR